MADVIGLLWAVMIALAFPSVFGFFLWSKGVFS